MTQAIQNVVTTIILYINYTVRLAKEGTVSYMSKSVEVITPNQSF